MESESTLVVLKTSLKPKLARASKPIPLANWNPKPNGKNLLCTFGFYYLFEYDKRNDEKMKK